MLFMGDLEQKGEQALMARMDLPDCDILKVGHHGSSGASSMVFLTEISPEWAIISCGENNRYGHPHAETLERLAKVGCRYVTTARQGAVTVTFSRNGFQVSGYLQK
jgi:competence protein ComEC